VGRPRPARAPRPRTAGFATRRTRRSRSPGSRALQRPERRTPLDLSTRLGGTLSFHHRAAAIAASSRSRVPRTVVVDGCWAHKLASTHKTLLSGVHELYAAASAWLTGRSRSDVAPDEPVLGEHSTTRPRHRSRDTERLGFRSANLSGEHLGSTLDSNARVEG
jgi:hypothetical protein